MCGFTLHIYRLFYVNDSRSYLFVNIQMQSSSPRADNLSYCFQVIRKSRDWPHSIHLRIDMFHDITKDVSCLKLHIGITSVLYKLHY